MGLIYLDSCLIIYLVERHPVWGAHVAAALAAEPEARFALSPLVKSECLVVPYRRGDLGLQRAFDELFTRLIALEMPEPVFLQAAQLRARFNLKTPDALHLACAQHHGCDALWTNDDRLQAKAGGIARNILAGVSAGR